MTMDAQAKASPIGEALASGKANIGGEERNILSVKRKTPEGEQ